MGHKEEIPTEDVEAHFVLSEVNRTSKNKTVSAALKAAKRSPLTALLTPSVTLKCTALFMATFLMILLGSGGRFLALSQDLELDRGFGRDGIKRGQVQKPPGT